MLDIIENKTFYISDSPSFEYKNSNKNCDTYGFTCLQDLEKLMNYNVDKFFVFYNIFLSASKIGTNTRTHGLRGKFIEDPSYRRDKIIDEVLGE